MRRFRQDLAALFGSTGRPAVSTFACWACAALAYPLARKGGYAGAVGAALVFSLVVLFLAYVLGSGSLACVGDAQRSCLPGSRRLARRAYLLASVLLLPALLLTVAALAGNPVWPAWVPTALVLAIALAGVLAARRPVAGAGLVLLVVLAACWAASGRGGHGHGKEWLFALLAPALVLIAAAVPLSAAVEWRVLRRSSRSRAARFLARGVRTDTPEARRQAPRTVSSRPGSREGQPPARIVRTCLGGMFVRPSRQLITGAVLLALFIAAAIGLPWLGASGRRWAVTALTIAAGGLIASGFLSQLPNLTRGQIAELALLPGLGAAAAQRRALCRAVLVPPLAWLGIVLLLGSADLLLKGEPAASVGLLAVSLFVMWLAYAVLALQKLAMLPPKRQSFISEFVLLYVVVCASGIYWVYAAQPPFGLWFWFWITPVLVCVGVASAIGFSLRRFAKAPHPFLS
jgi:hypothetical protein